MIASLLASMFLAFAVFQLLLALGAPLGDAAWGGEHKVLPKKLRLMSFVSFGIFVIAFLVALSYTSSNLFTPNAYTDILLWVFATTFLLSALANLASKSATERHIMASLAIVMCLLSIILVLS